MVGEWAEGYGQQVKIGQLFNRVFNFLFYQEQWREKEPVDRRTLQFQQEVLGEKHPNTISSMADLTATYYMQGHYVKAETIKIDVLDLQ